MPSDEVRVEREGRRVVVATIDRQDDQNRLTPEAFAALEELVRALAADEDAQTLEITGGGSEFF
jgi:enoyl-CoA hydratase/carnithine racemase